MRGTETYESFPADRFHKPIYNLRDQFSTDFSTSNFSWITIHARFPETTLMKQGWDWICCTLVRLVLHSTLCYLLDDVYKI